jgi:HEAT repeat protein
VVFAAIASGASQAVRREAVGLLPRFVNNHGDLVRKKLLALIGSAQVQLRRQAAGVMGRLADPATLEALKQAAKTDSDQQVRRAAKKAVDRINKELKKAGDLATQQVELKKQLQRKQLEVQKAQLDLEILEKRLKRLEIERKLKGK